MRSLENEYRQDGSVLIQKNLTGGVPEEDKVQWIWEYPSFTISPGEKSGDFSALQKVVSESSVVEITIKGIYMITFHLDFIRLREKVNAGH